MDERTLRHYEQSAAYLAPRFVDVGSTFRMFFDEAFPAGGRVLDVGAGPGRETSALLDHGYDVVAVEPVAAFRAFALASDPRLAGRLHDGLLPDRLPSRADLGGPFDGILCSAVLQHLRREEMPACAAAFRSLLRDGGRVILSVPATRPGIDDATLRDDQGRLFTGVTADELRDAFATAGFRELWRRQRPDAKSRPGHSWVTQLLGL